MEVFSGDTEDGTEDVPGRKKSKLKTLKTRLFGRSKRTGEEGSTKLSQSESDITAGKGLGSEEDLECPQGMMGSRALSHDSIFLADPVQTDPEPVRVLSQENVHSKIKALQIKLQQQKMHLGPPPMVLPIRRPEDVGGHSEDVLPQRLPDSREDFISQGALIKAISQSASRPLSPTPKPAPTKSQTTSQSIPLSVPSIPPSSSVEPPLDFAAPAQFTPCLDTSAARHRMSVKPRNQRASTKKKIPTDVAESDTRNNSDPIEAVKEEEEEKLGTVEEITVETKPEEQNFPIISQSLPSKPAETAPKPSFPPQDHVISGTVPPVASQILRAKPHRRMDERPHSSYIESELKDKREGDFDIQVMSHEKRNTLNKLGLTDASSKELSSSGSFKSSSVHQQVQIEDQDAKGIRRPGQGSGSFHFSITTAKNRDAERPRSGSFVEVLEQATARQKMTKDTQEKSGKEKDDAKGLQPQGSPFTVGRLRQEAGPLKSSVTPWEKRDSLKRVATKNAPTVSSTVDEEGVKNSQEAVEEAEEAKEVQEEEGKTPFGIKLRSTSQSMKLRSDCSPSHQPKSATTEDQSDLLRRQEACKTATNMNEKTPTNNSPPFTSKDTRSTAPVPTGFFSPVKHVAPFTDNPPVASAEVQVTSSNPKEAESTQKPPEVQPSPQTASAEVSWMSLAMEKTKSLQQLFTSRFPRDLTGTQTAARPQAQVQPTSQAEAAIGTQTQTVKVQPSATQQQTENLPTAETSKAEALQSRSQTQTVKPSPAGVQQKSSVASPVLANPSREPRLSKQTPEVQSNTSQPVSHPPVQTNRTETTTQPTQGGSTPSLAQSYLSSGQQQPSWMNRSLQPVSQPKPPAAAFSIPTAPSATVPPSVSTLGRGETVQKEGSFVSGRRPVWTGSVSDRAAFLERRTEWTAQTGPNGVEQRKAQIEVQTSAEPPAKTTPVSKDTAPEGRQGVKPAESSPTKVPDRPREERWPRKNVLQSSSPSSSPTIPSVLQSMSDSGQPSWMELAKRKSMAWSDKTMD